MSRRIAFTSFAGGNKDFRASAQRIKSEAIESNFYDDVYVCDDSDPFDNIKVLLETHKHYLNNRGFGYMIWKPVLLLWVFKLLKPGDIICYADSGCQISKFGKNKFDEYIELCDEHDALFFHMPPYIEKNWTKKILLDHLNLSNDLKITETPQIQSTHFYIKVNDVNYQLIKSWAEIAIKDNYIYSNDVNSNGIDESTYQEHRHDQSILSLLAKKAGLYSLKHECHYRNMDYYMNSPVLLNPILSVRNRYGKTKYLLAFKYSTMAIIESDRLDHLIFKQISFLFEFLIKFFIYIKNRIDEKKSVDETRLNAYGLHRRQLEEFKDL